MAHGSIVDKIRAKTRKHGNCSKDPRPCGPIRAKEKRSVSEFRRIMIQTSLVQSFSLIIPVPGNLHFLLLLGPFRHPHVQSKCRTQPPSTPKTETVWHTHVCVDYALHRLVRFRLDIRLCIGGRTVFFSARWVFFQ